MSHIKIDRKILEWEWWSDVNTFRLFTYMLLKANWKNGRFKGVEIPRGSFVSSLSKLSEQTNLTVDEIRTAIKHLKATEEITSKSHGKFTVFTVNNYNLYQGEPEQVPSKSQPIPMQFPTIEEEKENKEGNKNNKDMCIADANALFEKLWKRYPVKKGKGQVSLAARQRLLKVGHDEMTRAIDRYLAELEKDSDWRKPQNGSTFFNSGYIDYLDDNYVPGEDKGTKRAKNRFDSFPQRQRNAEEMRSLEKMLLSKEREGK